MTRFVASLSLFLVACGAPVHHLEADVPQATLVTAQTLAQPGPIEWEAVVSANWAVDRSGLVDLTDPRAASLEDDKHPIVLPVHLLTHPQAGTWMIDSGVGEELPLAGPLAPLLRGFVGDLEVLEPVNRILADRDLELAGVVLTHAHFDHVLGLPDVPADVPVYAGAHEAEAHRFQDHALMPSIRKALDGHMLHTLPYTEATTWSEGLPAIDLLGDGSLWALHVPGHTPGSTALLARTTEGPVLFTGDCSHTHWGWDHGVTPGTFTVDHDRNVASLHALKRLAEHIEGVQVVVGHEL